MEHQKLLWHQNKVSLAKQWAQESQPFNMERHELIHTWNLSKNQKIILNMNRTNFLLIGEEWVCKSRVELSCDFSPVTESFFYLFFLSILPLFDAQF